MDRVIIDQNFKVDVPQEGKNDDGTPKRAEVVAYTKGMVIDVDKIPEGQSAEDWIAKGLAKAAE